MTTINCHECGEEIDIEYDDIIHYICNESLSSCEKSTIIKSVIDIKNQNAFQDLIIDDFISKFREYCKNGKDFKVEVKNGVLIFK